MNKAVLSLRTGDTVATVIAPLINPNNLKIEGFYCQDKFDKNAQPILLAQDIRDIISKGFVINDHEALSSPAELIRIKDIIDLNFELIGKPVMTISKEKVGKVQDFAAESETLYIQKIYVGQSLLKSFGTGQLSVDRSNIVEITNKKIVIQDLLRPTKGTVTAPASLA